MTLIANMAVAAVEVMVSKYVEEKYTTMSSSSGLQLDPDGDDYTGLIDSLYRRSNTYLIWLILIGAFVILFLVMKRLFK